MRDVVHIKIIDGQEIIAELGDEESGILVLKNPMKVEERLTESGSTAIIMSRYNIFSNNEFMVLDLDKVISYTKVHKTMNEYYFSSVDYCKRFIDDKIVNDLARSNKAIQKKLSVKIEEEPKPSAEPMDLSTLDDESLALALLPSPSIYLN
jgi:hypothetical protein